MFVIHKDRILGRDNVARLIDGLEHLSRGSPSNSGWAWTHCPGAG